ncbi:MAG: 2-amino-4-hydroxy-6-hydroxymethyldihydropteridine diphosphokinase [Xanthomonadales bacterium]|nr:2-amino-4-hydroxy-6-hydroxymethyldihydropteridine diphosphokinase [Xanthomonadales bacterium]
MYAWLGLGSNQQNPVARLNEALDQLAKLDRTVIIATSSFYRTPPWGDEHQDDFVNAVTQLETSLAPADLLAGTRGIEDSMGRVRSARRWGPRVIDIDLLLYGSERFKLDHLEVPHPRMHERAFVLVPLAELDRSLDIPGRGTVGKLLQNIDRSGIIRLEDGQAS